MVSPPFAVHDLGEVAIRCTDLEAMLAFYRDIIGLPVLRPPENGIAFLKIGAGYAGHICVLALFDKDAGRPAIHERGAEAVATGAGSSLHHLALTIDFAAQDAAVGWYEGHGLAPVVQVFDWIGWRGVFVKDPEGNTVELVARDPDWQG